MKILLKQKTLKITSFSIAAQLGKQHYMKGSVNEKIICFDREKHNLGLLFNKVRKIHNSEMSFRQIKRTKSYPDTLTR